MAYLGTHSTTPIIPEFPCTGYGDLLLVEPHGKSEKISEPVVSYLSCILSAIYLLGIFRHSTIWRHFGTGWDLFQPRQVSPSHWCTPRTSVQRESIHDIPEHGYFRRQKFGVSEEIYFAPNCGTLVF